MGAVVPRSNSNSTRANQTAVVTGCAVGQRGIGQAEGGGNSGAAIKLFHCGGGHTSGGDTNGRCFAAI